MRFSADGKNSASQRRTRSRFLEKNRNCRLYLQDRLVFNWTRRIKGMPVPRLDDGALAENQPMDLARLNRWITANVTVKGRSDWIFVKLYCHGFFDHDQSACIGEDARRFFSEIIENGEKTQILKFISHRRGKRSIWFRRQLTANREIRASFAIIV